MTTAFQKQRLADFKAAKAIAVSIEKGHMRRASGTNYCGAKLSDGRMFVIGDTDEDLQKPDAVIDGKPAREVFADQTIMLID